MNNILRYKRVTAFLVVKRLMLLWFPSFWEFVLGVRLPVLFLERYWPARN